MAASELAAMKFTLLSKLWTKSPGVIWETGLMSVVRLADAHGNDTWLEKGAIVKQPA